MASVTAPATAVPRPTLAGVKVLDGRGINGRFAPNRNRNFFDFQAFSDPI